MPTPLPVLPAVYYGQMRGKVDGTLPFANQFCWQTDTVPASPAADSTNANHVATTVIGSWIAHMCPILPDAYTTVEAVFYPLGHPLLPAEVVVDLTPGAVAGNLAPIKTAILVHESVHRRGRGSQSRSFLGPVPRDFVDATGQVFTNSAVWETHWNDFNASVKTVLDGLGLGVWTRKQLSKKGTGATYDIVSSAVSSVFSTQRRRAGS